jgi:hypothetical protein
VYVAGIVDYRFAIQPSAKALQKIVVGTIGTPQSAVPHSRLRHTCIEIEHSDEAWPLSRPIGDGEDRAAMRGESGKNVMTVLPYRFDNNKGSIRWNLTKDLNAMALAVNETVFLDGIVGMAAAHRAPTAADGSRYLALQLFLCGPACLVRGDA